MSDFEINLVDRVRGGSAECRRLRKAGLIPSVIYGHNQESLAVAIDNLDFVKKASRARSSQIFYFKSESNKQVNGKPALVKDIQRDFIKGSVLHVDFQILREDEEVSVMVPLHVVGVPFGVKNDGGVLAVAAYNLTISALPKDIPQSVEVDVTDLKLGHAIEAQEVPLPKGARLVGNPHEVVASVVLSKLTATATPAAGATDAADASAAKPADKK